MNDRLDQIHWEITLHAILDNGEPMSWNLFLAFVPLVFSCMLFYRPSSAIVRGGIWLLLGLTVAGSYSRIQALAVAIAQRIQPDPWAILGAIAGLSLVLGMVYRYQEEPRLRTLVWWLGVIIFLLFLPNAAYILTDFIHLVLDIRRGYPMGTVILFLIPQYLFFIGVGFTAYVVSILHLELGLRQRELTVPIVGLELVIHGFSAIGVYLGRFARLNSWDVLAHPTQLMNTLQTVFLSRHAIAVIMTLFVIFTICHWLWKRILIGLMLQKQGGLKRTFLSGIDY